LPLNDRVSIGVGLGAIVGTGDGAFEGVAVGRLSFEEVQQIQPMIRETKEIIVNSKNNLNFILQPHTLNQPY